MREHKFRFYYKGKLIDELTLKEIAAKCEYHWADDVVVAEYTGMNDGKGREIYEWDILRDWISDKTWKVIFSFCMFRLTDGFITIPLTEVFCPGRPNCEVIGCNFVNPELLDG